MLNAVLQFFDISDTVGWASEWESGLLEYRSSNLLKVFLYILGRSLADHWLTQTNLETGR